MPLRKGFRTAWPHIAALPCPTIGLGWAVPPWGGQAAPCVLLATQFSAKQPLRVSVKFWWALGAIGQPLY